MNEEKTSPIEDKAALDGSKEEHQTRVRGALQQSDLDMIRVLEDLIKVLIEKGVIEMSSLPAAAREKLRDRIQMRHHLSDLSDIVSEREEDIFLP